MATIVISEFTTQKVSNGLNTYQYTIPVAGVYSMKIRTEKLPASTMTIAIQKNGTPIATTTLAAVDTTNGQSTANLSVLSNCVVNDVISFVLTSSNAVDQQLNSVISFISCYIGTN